MKINISRYIIRDTLSQLISNINIWHSVMILVKIYYKTDNKKLLAIVKAIKTKRCYLKIDRFEDLILINTNIFSKFRFIKNVSSR